MLERVCMGDIKPRSAERTLLESLENLVIVVLLLETLQRMQARD